MANPTLLEITQEILSALDSDAVNSIADTVESTQVATIVRRKYYDILSRGNLPDQQVLLQLTASGDTTKPTLMYLPAGTVQIDWLKYYDANPNDSQQVNQFGSFSHGVNSDLTSTPTWTTISSTSNSIATGAKTFTVASSTLTTSVGQGVAISSGTNTMFGTLTSYSGTTMVVTVTATVGSGTYSTWTLTSNSGSSIPGYKYVQGVPVDEFLNMVNRFNPADTNVGSYTFTEGSDSFSLYYKNDIQPQYFTVIENYYLLFDTFNSVLDNTLQASKTMAYGQKVTPFTMSDSFIPDIDRNDFPLLINEAKALAFFELKQTPHVKAEQEIKRQWSTVQKDKAVSNKPSHFDQLANFGRVPRTGGYGGYGVQRWMRTP